MKRHRSHGMAYTDIGLKIGDEVRVAVPRLLIDSLEEELKAIPYKDQEAILEESDKVFTNCNAFLTDSVNGVVVR